ncbi:MAG: hypothetical protein ACO1NX_06055 [Chitinophagaceae bacterium]
MKLKTTAFMVCLLVPAFLFSQAVTGIWKGTLTQAPGGCFPEYHVEMQITSVKDNKISGVCYHYSDINNYVKKDFEGFYNPETKTISISENKILTFRIPPDCIPCIRYFSLKHIVDTKKEYLSGDWGGVVMNTSTACSPGRIRLDRALQSEFEHIQEIKVDTGTIHLSFYDNGEIDGDTISVMLNKTVLVSKQRLAAKPINVDIKVDMENTEQEVTMVAENLGSIPPNTALLIVRAGNKKYQLYLKSTGTRNAQVRFIYRKDELAKEDAPVP